MSINAMCSKIKIYLNRKTKLVSPLQIPGFCEFSMLYKQMVDEVESGREVKFLEIGSFLGSSTALMAQFIKESGKKIDFYSVDPWTTDYYDNEDVKKCIYNSLGKSDYSGEVKKAIVELGLENYVTLIQSTTNQVVKDVLKDTKFDFIFIDGSHEYEDVLSDINTLLPFLKQGGTMAGDDYNHTPVKQAVEKAFGNNYKLSTGYAWSSWIYQKS